MPSRAFQLVPPSNQYKVLETFSIKTYCDAFESSSFGVRIFSAFLLQPHGEFGSHVKSLLCCCGSIMSYRAVFLFTQFEHKNSGLSEDLSCKSLQSQLIFLLPSILFLWPSFPDFINSLLSSYCRFIMIVYCVSSLELQQSITDMLFRYL